MDDAIGSAFSKRVIRSAAIIATATAKTASSTGAWSSGETDSSAANDKAVAGTSRGRSSSASCSHNHSHRRSRRRNRSRSRTPNRSSARLNHRRSSSGPARSSRRSGGWIAADGPIGLLTVEGLMRSWRGSRSRGGAQNVFEVPEMNRLGLPNHCEAIRRAIGAAVSAPNPPCSTVTAITIGRFGSGM